MKFNNAKFITSALELDELPTLKLPSGKHAPEIALIGRSNVGKSSLINTLLYNRSVAKTSSTPGKTQRINFFFIDEEALLVDLPGYGYSKAPKESIEYWSRAIDAYLNTRESLALVLLLLDIRREPCEEDYQIAKWALARGIPFITVYTKSDKVNKSEWPVLSGIRYGKQHPVIKEIADESDTKNKNKFPGCFGAMAFSNKGFQDRKFLIDLINKALE
jgi:GTP-binding protein